MYAAVPDDCSGGEPLVWTVDALPEFGDNEIQARIADAAQRTASRLHRVIFVEFPGHHIRALSGLPLGRVGRWLMRRAIRKAAA